MEKEPTALENICALVGCILPMSIAFFVLFAPGIWYASVKPLIALTDWQITEQKLDVYGAIYALAFFGLCFYEVIRWLRAKQARAPEGYYVFAYVLPEGWKECLDKSRGFLVEAVSPVEDRSMGGCVKAGCLSVVFVTLSAGVMSRTLPDYFSFGDSAGQTLFILGLAIMGIFLCANSVRYWRRALSMDHWLQFDFTPPSVIWVERVPGKAGQVGESLICQGLRLKNGPGHVELALLHSGDQVTVVVYGFRERAKQQVVEFAGLLAERFHLELVDKRSE